MDKLTFLGVGPKIARVTIPFLVIAIALTILFPRIFTFGEAIRTPFRIAGIILLAAAVAFYIATLYLMVPGIRKNQLITGGVYRLCRNPLYFALLILLIPGLGLLVNSWIILISSLLGCLAFRKFIPEEEEQLERIFGEEYRQYRDKTAWFFPKPW